MILKKDRLSRFCFFVLFFTILPIFSYSQGVLVKENDGKDEKTIDSSALLEVRSTEKGLLIPSMTTLQREAIATPANGLMVFDTDDNQLYYYDGTALEWQELAGIGTSGSAGNVAYWESATDLSALPFMRLDEVNQFVEVTSKALANDDDPIFEVKNKDGHVVFGVYQTGVRILVDDSPEKTSRGGFAVGGFTTGKDKSTVEYLRVTPDSVRVYVDNNASKTSRGGFAVGGFTTGKGHQELFRVTPDSTRIYIDDRPGKTSRGGFAVGGFTTGKQAPDHFFNIKSGLNPDTINPSEPRILWYPLANAFLAGQVLIEYPDSVGVNSWASGYETRAIGNFSQSIGYQTIARGLYSSAIGRGAVAAGETSFAFGFESVAKEKDSYAFGAGALALGEGSYAFGSMGRDTTAFTPTDFPTRADGNFALAMGLGARAEGIASTSIGNNTYAQGNNSLTMGAYSVASGKHAVAIGNDVLASGHNSVALGHKTEAGGWASIASGNESIASGLASTAMGRSTVASGWASTAFGDNTISSNEASTAFGNGAEASGRYAIAGGFNTTASAEGAIAIGRNSSAIAENAIAIGTALESSGNNVSVALGYFSTASGESSVAIGRNCETTASVSTAIGYYATAEGYASSAFGSSTTASGLNSTAMGNYTSALSGYEMVVGRYNTLYTPASTTAWNANDRLFVVANGTASTSRSNAMTILKNGNVGIGTVTPSQALSIDGNLSLEGGARYILMTGGNGYLRTTDASRHLYFQTGGAFTRMMISGVDGKVGIGTTAPSHKLNVNSASGEGALKVQVNGNTRLLVNSDESVIVGTNQSTGPARGLYVFGDTGLGVLSPSSKLHVDDNAVGPVARFSNNGNHYSRHGIYINAGANTSSGDHWLIRFYGGDGNYYAGSIKNTNGTLSFDQPSDKRLKMNITNADFNAIDILKNLRVAKFQYKDTRDQSFFNTGYIAQEVQKVLPGMVSEDPETGYLGVSPSYLIPVMHKAIQEQQEYIDELESRIERLEQILLEK